MSLAARIAGCALLIAWFGAVQAAPEAAGVSVRIDGAGSPESVSNAMKIFVALTALALAPAILIAMTAFTRIIIVLAILRQAIGMPETPPNTVLVSLALFLTLFT